MKSGELTRGAACAVLFALTALALVVRLWGLDFLLPHSTHLDGSILFEQVRLIRAHDPLAPDHPMWGYYPHLLSEIVARFLPDPNAQALPAGATLAQHVERAIAPILQIRYVAALASVLLVPGTYLLARRFMSRGWSLCAAAWIATSGLTTAFAQQDRPHGLAATLALFAVLAAVQLRRSARARDYVLTGVLVALAISALQYNVFVLLAVCVAHWLRARVSGRASSWWLLAIAVPLAVCIRYFYAFHFEGQRGLLEISDEEGGANLNISGQWIYLEHFNGAGFPVLLSALWSYDPVMLVLGALGAVTWGVRASLGRSDADAEGKRDAWVVLGYALPFATAIGVYAFSGERFLLPLEPYLACLGAWGLERTLGAWVRAQPALPRRAVATLGVIVLLQIPPAVCVLRMDAVRAAPDTFEEAAAWIAEHARPEEERIVALPYLELPLFHSERVLPAHAGFSYWARYQASAAPGTIAGPRFDYEMPGPRDETNAAYGEDPLAHLRAIDADWVVIQDVGPGYKRHPLIPKTLAALRASAERVARFSPLAVDDGSNANNSIRYPKTELSQPFVRRMLESRCMGPTIEIYRVGAAPLK